MTLSNAVMLVTNLNVARDPFSVGLFTLQNGGSVSVSNELAIGRFSGATGTVVVAGGQLTGSDLKIHVGEEGNGQMIVSNGAVQAADLLVAADLTNTANGALTVAGGNLNLSSSLFVGGASFSTGQVSITSGAISVSNAAGSAVMRVANGRLTFNGGTISADAVLLTNAAGTVVFNGGTLNTKGTMVANGAPFVVGNGVAAAKLHLNGGIHSFANSLIISSNATLDGCGTIIGVIVNHGIIATNCAAVLVRPTITRIARMGTNSIVSFTSVTGETYTLEFNNTLGNTNWGAILPSTNGSGSVMSVTDKVAVPSRFYRVRAQ
jgi:T5SS/PEP-CTERM-associated repeat protein